MNLIPVIAQDVKTNNVLMLAYANREALARTKKSGVMHYWSRSRGRLWRKGEESGHTQKMVSLHYDCDRDAILARVEQTGPACHRNTYSCFAAEPFPAVDVLRLLQQTIADRKRKPKKGSYTNRLLGDPQLARDKVLEEAAELCMATKGRDRAATIGEAADVLYHLLALLATRGISLGDVQAELDRRHR